MINKYVLLLLIICFGSVSLLHAQSKDAVKQANQLNKEKSDHNTVEKDVADFLVKSADARMMDAQEGKLATMKGTTREVRDYGRLMMKDQAMLLQKIKALAISLKITLPATMSNDKMEGREDLKSKSGKDFDGKFIKMMKIDHERDVKLFKQATKSDDKQTRTFAIKYLPLIQTHLEKIKEIKEAS